MPAPDPLPAKDDDSSPGVPFFQTWRGIYGFVFASFVVVVLLLALFSYVYA